MADKIKNIGNHMAFSCNCGSVHFNLLRDMQIECAKCGVQFGNWLKHKPKQLRLLGSDGIGDGGWHEDYYIHGISSCVDGLLIIQSTDE